MVGVPRTATTLSEATSVLATLATHSMQMATLVMVRKTNIRN